MKPKMMVAASRIEDVIFSCGGTIARYAEQGSEVHVVILSGGERKDAAEILGVSSIEYYGYEAPLLTMDKERIDRLATAIRKIRPDFIVTHGGKEDLLHPNHDLTWQSVMAAYQAASGAGYVDGCPVSPRQTPIFGFEPYDAGRCGFDAQIYIDISRVMDKKTAAMKACQTSDELCQRYMRKAELRAEECSAGRETVCAGAEAFSSFGPIAKHGYFVW